MKTRHFHFAENQTFSFCLDNGRSEALHRQGRDYGKGTEHDSGFMYTDREEAIEELEMQENIEKWPFAIHHSFLVSLTEIVIKCRFKME